MKIPHLVGNDITATTIRGYRTLAFKPFDPVSKLTQATIRSDNGSEFEVAKGNK